MLTAEGCTNRRARLWDALPTEYEWVLVADPRHVLYFSNFLVNPISFSTSERGLLLLERSGRSTLLADNFSHRSAAATPFVDEEIIEKWYDHRHSVTNRDRFLFRQLKQVAARIQGRGLVESEWLPVAVADELELDPVTRSLELGTIIRQLRRQKEADEIALMEQCMRACESGHARAIEVVQPGISELDVYREVQSAATATAGHPIIVYGDFRTTNSRIPKRGGLPTTELMQEGDLLILDYSVLLHGYRSDFTNTIAVGEPSAEQRRIFELCELAMQAGELKLKAESAAADVYTATSSVLEEAGHSPLGHHAGHGIGLGHPEPPILVPESQDVLLVEDVVTLEVGLYVEGVGGVRSEHNYLITETGFHRLSHHRLGLA